MRVKTAEGKIKDVSVLNVTPENFIVPTGEERYYHCRIEVKKFNPDNGQRLSTPRMQCFGKKFFENGGKDELVRQGYTVDVLHDPNEWLAANAEKDAEEKRKQAEEMQRKADEAKKAEKEAMKAEIIAELKASGVIPATDPAPEAKGNKRGKKETKADAPETNEAPEETKE